MLSLSQKAQISISTLKKAGIALILISISGVLLDEMLLLFAPIGILLGALCFYDIRIPFLFLFGFIPISWEQELGSGFGTDLPTEPMMVFLMGLGLFLVIKQSKRINSKIFTHPITILLLAHYGWLWASTIWSENIFVSVKFCLAKTWYISVFYLLSILLLRSKNIIRLLFQMILWPLTVVTLIILYRHSLEDFSFESANFVMAPFFRNHVTSAALMSTMVPFVVFLWLRSKNILIKTLYFLSLVILILGAYFSYTRAAHLAIVLSITMIPIIKWRLMKSVILIGLVGLTIFTYDIIKDNKYIGLAPDFETTVSHKTFDDLVSATYQGKDISTMERLYRWVAGYRMVQKKPWFGFGPGNFYNYYKSYTLTIFQTYVSDNPEMSGIHCYFLMILTEQGFIGLAIFLLLICIALVYMEKVYHNLEDGFDRMLMMTVSMCFTIIILFQLINDLIETDKTGPFFFLALALTVALDLKSKGESVIKISEN